MKDTIILFIILFLMTTNASAQNKLQKIDSIYRVRNFVIQELLSFGFEVEESNRTTTVLSSSEGPGDYSYQVAVTVKRERLNIEGYAFILSHIKPSWVAKPWYGKEKIYEVIYSGVQWSKGITLPKLYLWNWERKLPR